MKTFLAMLKCELRLSVRGMDMVIFALCMPLVVLIILGAISGGGEEFRQSFAAVSTIAVCAGGAMGLPLVVSDYREKKILKRFHVTPVSAAMILAADTAMYAVYSFSSLILLYITAHLFFGFSFAGTFGAFFASYILIMISMFSIGIMVGGVARDSKIASVIASVLYFPMLIFSGATLPYEVMPPILQRIADVMPLTQGIALLKAAITNTAVENVAFSVAIMLALAIISSTVAIRFFRWE